MMLIVSAVRCDAAAAAEVSKEAIADFNWFRSLGYASATEFEFGTAVRGTGKIRSGPLLASLDSYGLLDSEDNRLLKLFTLDSRFRWFPTDQTERFWYRAEVQPLDEFAREVLSELEVSELNFPRGWAPRTHQFSQLFVLANWCHEKDFPVEALQLYNAARELQRLVRPVRETEAEEMASSARFRMALQRELGHAQMWEGVLRIADTNITRADLLGDFRSLTNHFPKSDYFERAASIVGVLEQMVDEDLLHQSFAPDEFEQLSQEEQISELIFRLRDQTCQHMTHRGGCDIFLSESNSPANQLLGYGEAAVPFLIAAMDDERLTRAVKYNREFFFSHDVRRVGECARIIFTGITGKEVANRAEAEAWWEQFRNDGMLAAYIAETTSGGQNARTFARRLIEEYPEHAVKPIIAGVRASRTTTDAVRLIELLRSVESELIDPFLRTLVDESDSLRLRVASAYALSVRGRPVPLGTTLTELNALEEEESNDSLAVIYLLEYLRYLDSPQAIRGLSARMSGFATENRFLALDLLLGKGAGHLVSSTALSLPSMEAIEEMLISALEDEGQNFGRSGSRGGTRYIAPRVCDFAGFYLQERWPDRYLFDISAPLRIRDRQRNGILQRWRQERGLSANEWSEAPPQILPQSDANVVTLVDWGDTGLEVPERFRANLEAIQGQPMTTGFVSNLVETIVTAPHEDVSTWTIWLERPDDLTGVHLHMNLLPGTKPRSEYRWGCNAMVNIDGQSRPGMGVGSQRDQLLRSGVGWSRFLSSVEEALETDARTPFVIGVEIEDYGRNE